MPSDEAGGKPGEGWTPEEKGQGWIAHPLKKRSNGTRSTTLELERGERYSFKYLSDGGTWFNDPDAHAHDVNEFGETNSVIQT